MTDNAKQNLAPVAFREAVARDDLTAVKNFMQQGERLYDVDDMGRDMLCLAITHGAMEVTRFFIETGADINRPSRSNIYPLMYAVCHERREIFHLLLERGADVNARTEHDWTAVMYAACNNGREDVMRLLIEKGADTTVCDNRNGQSPLDVAEGWNREGIAELLRNAAEIYRKAEEARYQVKHVKFAARQEELKVHAGRAKLRMPRP